MVRPTFYQNPQSQTDLNVEADPSITIDIGTGSGLLIEGYFSAAHNQASQYFDFNQADSDAIDIGPTWTLNSHMELYTSLRFFLANISFKEAVPYLNLAIAL